MNKLSALLVPYLSVRIQGVLISARACHEIFGDKRDSVQARDALLSRRSVRRGTRRFASLSLRRRRSLGEEFLGASEGYLNGSNNRGYFTLLRLRRLLKTWIALKKVSFRNFLEKGISSPKAVSSPKAKGISRRRQFLSSPVSDGYPRDPSLLLLAHLSVPSTSPKANSLNRFLKDRL